jgi:cell division transport system permease protein
MNIRSLLQKLSPFGREESAAAVAAGALSGDSAGRILPYATALMAFLAALALAAALGVGDAATRWSAGFGGGLTIQLGAPPAKSADPLPRIVEMLLATPGVATVSETPEEDINRLLAPWLGGLVDLEGLPKPRFLEATLAPGASLDAAIVEARLRDADPNVKVDDHDVWAEKLAEYARAVARTAWVAALLIGIISAAAVAAVAAARMAIHADAIRLLRQLGATDRWISGLIARASLRQGLIGGVIGVGLAALAVFLVERAAEGASALLPTPRLDGWAWAALAILPLGAGAVAVAAARIAALLWLRRR